MLILSDGKKHGVIDFSGALKLAKDSSLDLVQVSPADAIPVVCKLLDYGKFLDQCYLKKKYHLYLRKWHIYCIISFFTIGKICYKTLIIKKNHLKIVLCPRSNLFLNEKFPLM